MGIKHQTFKPLVQMEILFEFGLQYFQQSSKDITILLDIY